MNKQQLATKIWESANKMRSKIEANEYKDYILGFIFYKYLSDKELKFLKDNDFSDEDLKTVTEDDPETVKYVQQNIGYNTIYNFIVHIFQLLSYRRNISAFGRYSCCIITMNYCMPFNAVQFSLRNNSLQSFFHVHLKYLLVTACIPRLCLA